MDLLCIWHDNRYWSKILFGTTLTPAYDVKVKVTDLEIYVKVFSSPELQAPGELTGWQPPPSTFSNWNIFATCKQISTRFYLWHVFDGGLLAYAFKENCFRTLVAVATDMCHRLTIGKCL